MELLTETTVGQTNRGTRQVGRGGLPGGLSVGFPQHADQVVGRMTAIKQRLEASALMDTFDHVYSVYIQAPQERVWQAIRQFGRGPMESPAAIAGPTMRM